MNVLALDIGGANLKAADGQGFAACVDFPLWRYPKRLSSALRDLIASSPPADRLVVTMTGELADCYRTKSEGVREILSSVNEAAAGRPITVYGTDGCFVTPEIAVKNPLLAAASNWHALARFACRYLGGGSGLLIDIGSTTTDVVPLGTDGPANQAATDPERLACGELVYTGVIRSPVCALVGELPWREKKVRVAQEVFATTQDVYVTLGDLAEEVENVSTADGRPRTRDHSRDRLARCLGADREMFSEEDAKNVALAVRNAQSELIGEATRQVLSATSSSPEVVVVSGQGEFLGRQVVEALACGAEVVSLNNSLGAEASRAAPAHALAVLARENLAQ